MTNSLLRSRTLHPPRAFLAAAGLALLCQQAPSLAQVPPGTGSWSTAQTWAADSVNGGSLTGYFYWPASVPAAGTGRALVLTLHGCTQTASGDVIDKAADRGYNWKSVAEQYGAVILAPNATGNVYSNHCWDYASGRHNRTTGHDGVLLNLISRFINNSQFAIDPNQVYVAGLSSGGGEAMALACLAPDIFAGVGINAGPPPGTTTAQIGYVPSGYTAATAANNCKALAGANSGKFSSQIASVIWGASDYTVAQAYGPMDAAAMRGAYGGTFTKEVIATLPGGGSNTPYTDSNGQLRTSEIVVTGMGHAWPAGAGGQNSHYVDATRVNYPAFLMDFWSRNNLRVAAINAPRVSVCSATVNGNTVTVSGAGAVPGGSIGSYTVYLSGNTVVNDSTAGSGASFSKPYQLANGQYSGSVTASAAGVISAPCIIGQFLVGPAPALPAPSGLSASNTTASSMILNWSAVSGAAAYNLYRDSVKLNASALPATSYADTGLAANTSYSYRVSALNSAGAESALSAGITASTTSAFSCTSILASNYAHVLAGRAHDSGGFALANGSNQNMGLDNVFYINRLAQTSDGYYLIGECP